MWKKIENRPAASFHRGTPPVFERAWMGYHSECRLTRAVQETQKRSLGLDGKVERGCGDKRPRKLVPYQKLATK